MKRILSFFVAALIAVGTLAGAGAAFASEPASPSEIFEDGGFDRYSGVQQLPEWLAGPAPAFDEYGMATVSGEVVSSNPAYYVVAPENKYGQLVGGGTPEGETAPRQFSNLFMKVPRFEKQAGTYTFEMDISLPLDSFGDGMLGLLRLGKTPESSAAVDLDAALPGVILYDSKTAFGTATGGAQADANGFYHLTADISAFPAAEVDCIALYHQNFGFDLQASVDNVRLTYRPQAGGESKLLYSQDFEACRITGDVGIGAAPNNRSYSYSSSAPVIKTVEGDSFLRLAYDPASAPEGDGKSELIKQLDAEALVAEGVGLYVVEFDVFTDASLFDYKPQEGESSESVASKNANFKFFLTDGSFKLSLEKPVFSRASGYKGLVSSPAKDGWKHVRSEIYLPQYYATRLSQLVFSLTTGKRELSVDIDNVTMKKKPGTGTMQESPAAPAGSTFRELVEAGSFEELAVGALGREPQKGWGANVSDAVINGKIAEEAGNRFLRLDCTEKLETGLVAEALVQLDTAFWKTGRVYRISYDFRITGSDASLDWIRNYLPSGAHVSFFSSSAKEFYSQVLLPSDDRYDLNANLIQSGDAYPVTVTDSASMPGWKHLEMTFEIDEAFAEQVDCIEMILANPYTLGGLPQDAALALDFDNFSFGYYRLAGEEEPNGNGGDDKPEPEPAGCGCCGTVGGSGGGTLAGLLAVVAVIGGAVVLRSRKDGDLRS